VTTTEPSIPAVAPTAPPTAHQALETLAERLDALGSDVTWLPPASVAKLVREFAATVPDGAAGRPSGALWRDREGDVYAFTDDDGSWLLSAAATTTEPLCWLRGPKNRAAIEREDGPLWRIPAAPGGAR
jgi:hypothetical protein